MDHDLRQRARSNEPPPGEAADLGYFGPETVTWRVHGDPIMVLGGLRAVLLQALHPLAMAAVTQHSDFRADPWGRLLRTARFVGVTSFGTRAEAAAAAAHVRGIHRTIQGNEPNSGARYRADDPELLRWVHCCEVESFLTTYRRAGGHLDAADPARYYAEQRVIGQLVGADGLPADEAALDEYFSSIRTSLRATPDTRAAARIVVAPPMPWRLTAARPAWAGLGSLAFALLPRWARRLYGLPGLSVTDRAATAAAWSLRTTLLTIPPRLRDGPHLGAAKARWNLVA